MNILNEAADKIKEMKDDGIAISSIKISKGDESVEIVVGRIETRDIFEPGKDSVPKKSMEDEELDLYHVR